MIRCSNEKKSVVALRLIRPKMGLGPFYILFENNPSKVFFPGQIVKGVVHVSITKKPKKLKGVVLESQGWAHVAFNHGKHRFSSHEKYFEGAIPIHGELGRDHFELSVGHHTFPFQFALLKNLPSSFEGHYGYVRYTLQAVLQRPWKFNQTCKIAYTINTIVDLNISPHAKLHSEGTNSKNLCCFCCRSGPINAKAWLDRIGYVPGETIYFNGEVENLSKKKMKGCKVVLVERALFKTTTANEETERILIEKRHGEFLESDIWENVPIVVPPVAPSNLPHCRIIDINYQLRFIVDMPNKLSFNLIVPLNILIGNVPLRQCFPSFQPEQSTENSTAASEERLNLPIQDYPDLPHPSFQEGIFDGVDIVNSINPNRVSNGQALSYKPCYISYNQNF